MFHTIDQTREQFWFITRESTVRVGKALQSNRKLNITGADNILDLKILKFSGKTKLLNDPSVLMIQSIIILDNYFDY